MSYLNETYNFIIKSKMGSWWGCHKHTSEKEKEKLVKNEEIITINKNKKVDYNYYDLSLKINKIKDIAHEGLEIEMKDNNTNFENEFLKIGITGESKKGKTFILQKLLNEKIDEDTIIKAKGLGIKFNKKPNDENKKNNYLIIDNESVEKPLINSEKSDLIINNNIELNEIEDLIKEKLLKELFLQHFIFKYSEIPILVVNEINFSEQTLLSKIQNILKNNKRPKKLFVIHNLQNYKTIKEVKDYINEILLKLAGVNLKIRNNIQTEMIEAYNEKEQKNYIYYEQESSNEVYKIIHLVMANENSEAGKYYNNFAIEHIKYHINQFTDIPEISIPNLLIENFIELSQSILNESIDKSKFNIIKTDTKIIIKYNGEISYRKHVDYQLETFNLYNNAITPEYRYYINDDEFIIELEVAGKTKDVECDNELKNEYYYFNFSGKKIDDIKNNLELKNYYTSSKNNIFKLNLAIPSANIILKSDDYKFEDCGNGILSFKFKLHQKSKIRKTYE